MIELINLGMSVFGGAGVTMAGRVINAVTDVFTNLSMAGNEALQAQHDRDVEAHKRSEESQANARKFIGTKGFHRTRQLIAKWVIFCYFILPMTLPAVLALFGIPLEFSIGYFDISQGWPWQTDVEQVHWVTTGTPGGVVIVITPVMNNAVLTIIGMFFGNQMCKR